VAIVVDLYQKESQGSLATIGGNYPRHILRLASGRRQLFLIHFEHIEDLGYDAIKRAMLFAENVAPSIEPDSRFFELCDTWMQRQDINAVLSSMSPRI
jgi:hypothetical protein